MNRTALRLIFLSCVLFLFPLWAFGQRETGQITGTITDSSGAVVSGAKVTAKSVTTGVPRETTTSTAGIYLISALQPGTYEVTVEATGFKKFEQRVQVLVGSTSDISAKLQVGAATEVVEVTAIAAIATANTENATLSQVITFQTLNDVPTSATRNPYALVGTAGNVTEDTSSNRGAGYAINGLRSSSTSILLDGAENVDTFTAAVGQFVPLDSIQEFSVLTSNFGAEFGRGSAGVVNVVTRSGTNAFHGSAFEFNRISALSANTWQNDANGTPKGTFTRNDFGFSLGGPIKKNKLFFFNNLEWIRVRSTANQQLTILDPSSYPLLGAASQTFFNTFGKLASGVSTVKTGACGTTTPTLTCDQVSFPVASDSGGGSPQNTWMELARVDYHLTDRTTLMGRYTSYKELDFDGTVNASPYAGYNTGQTNYDQNILFELTHVFSPHVVNSTKLAYNRINGPVQPLGIAPIGPTLYTSGAVPSVFGTSLVFPGYNETTPGNAIPFGGPQNLYQVYDDLSWSTGKHSLKFGGQYIHIRDNRIFGAYENAVELLGTNLNTGLQNLIAGNIFQFEGAIFPQGKFPCFANPTTGKAVVTPDCTLTLPVGPPAFGRNFHYNDMSFYGQDEWKITPRLTLTLGLRWEYYGVQHNADPSLDSNFVMGPGDTIFNQVRNGQVELAQNGGVFWKPRYGNFGPHIGFAYDVFGDGKTSLRGGYAIGYERNFGNVTFNAIQNPPNYGVISLQSFVDVPGALPVFTDNAGPLAGTGTKPLPAVSQRAINQNMKSAYAETYNLSIEHQVGKGLISAAYAGSHGIHLYDISNLNPATAGSVFLGDARTNNRLNFQYGNMNFRSDNGFSHYNGVNVGYRVNNLFNKGIGLIANYTWSHTIDNLSSTFTELGGGTQSGLYQLGYLDAYNPNLNKGNADYDIRHRFVLAWTWEIPWMKNSSSAIARQVLGGWGLGSFFNIRTGAPFSIYDCTNLGGTNCPLWATSQVASVPKTGTAVASGEPNLFNYITLPNVGGTVVDQGVATGMPVCSGLDHVGCVYTTGGVPYPARNQYYGPGYWNIDLNVYKNFRLTERFQLQFRSEMYNVFNHHNQYITNLNLDVSSLTNQFIQTEKGGICGSAGLSGTCADERRNIQFGLRLTF